MNEKDKITKYIVGFLIIVLIACTFFWSGTDDNSDDVTVQSVNEQLEQAERDQQRITEQIESITGTAGTISTGIVRLEELNSGASSTVEQAKALLDESDRLIEQDERILREAYEQATSGDRD